MLSQVVIDFETTSQADLAEVGPWKYAEDPTTEILCLSYSTDGGVPQTWVPGGVLPCWPDGCWIIAFNVQFEKAIWKNLMVPMFGAAPIEPHRWHDIQAVCGMKGLPQSLDKAISALGLPDEKDKEGSKYVISLSKPNKKTGMLPSVDIDRVRRYCEQDIRAEGELHKRVEWLPSGERQVWLVNQRLNERGLRLDLEFIRAAKTVVSRAATPLVEEFRKLTGGINPTQRDKIIQWVEGQGGRLSDLRKETVAEALDEDAEVGMAGVERFSGTGSVALPDNVRRALTIRSLVGSSSIKKLDRMEMSVCADGRSRGLLHYHGTGPGRAAGRLWQPHNLPRPTVKIDGKAPDPNEIVAAIKTGDPEYVEMLYGPAIQAVSHSLRHAIVPDRGRKFISGDYAGIQLRVLLALAGQHDKCDLLAKGQNAYCDMAFQIYGREIDKHNDIVEYTMGKNSVLGLGFQMGPDKFHTKYAKEHPVEFCEEVVNVYRRKWAPLVPPLWYAYSDAATECVWEKAPRFAGHCEFKLEDGWLTIRLPSGRKLWYFNPVPVKTAYGRSWRYTNNFGGYTGVFGGLITENIVMGVECDITRHAAITLENAGIPQVLEVHDELVSEPKEGQTSEKEVRQIMEDVPRWVKELGVPINVETWEGDRYRK